MNRVPTSTLFPILTSLIQPATPTWFRVHLSTALSLLPLRPNGVQQTITFIASTAPQAQNDPAEQGASVNGRVSGPTLSVQTLEQASKLLAAVPSSLTADAYFTALGPQLLRLLDGKEIEEKRAAAYIIGNGILGRRKYGAPGTIGWQVFAEPILDNITPKSTGIDASKRAKPVRNDDFGNIIVSEYSLKQALDRLSSLLLLHPNPGLTRRLITPSILALWGLWFYSKETKRSSWADQLLELFCVYFKTAAGVEQFIYLIEQLQWAGGKSWAYAAGPKGGIEIRERLEASSENPNIVTMVQNIDIRIDGLMRLLGARVLDDENIIAVFLHASKHWLLDNEGTSGRNSLEVGDTSIDDPLLRVVYARITQKILEEYKDKLAAKPRKVIEFVNQLLAAFVAEHRDLERKALKASKPSIAGLSSILNSETEHNVKADSHSGAAEEDRTEIVSIALNLLSAILTSSIPSRTPSNVDFVDIRRNLGFLANSQNLPTSVILAASNVLALVDFQIPNASPIPDQMPAPLDRHDADRKSHNLALTYLVDPLPPIRAQGLSLLTDLVKKASPVLDISSTTILLISLFQDEDEFIYLSAVRALGLLASRHSRTVVKMLVENYVDTSENRELDVRIRIGEVLLKTVESLGEKLVGQPARLVGEGMITVAGRRGKRIKQMKAQAQRSQGEENSKKEAEEAWGGDIPSLQDEVEDETGKKLTKVVIGWEGSQGEEDVRVRTSALSVLGVAIETNIAGMGSSIVSTAVDLVLAILKLETTDEKAILRRAAVLVVLSLVKALDAADEAGRKLGFGFAGENLAEVNAVLRYIETTDSDALVKGHVGVVIEGLETWQSKTILGMPGSGVSLAPRTVFDGDRLAGLSVNPETLRAVRPKIEEIE